MLLRRGACADARWLQELGVTVLAWAPLASGRLTSPLAAILLGTT